MKFIASVIGFVAMMMMIPHRHLCSAFQSCSHLVTHRSRRIHTSTTYQVSTLIPSDLDSEDSDNAVNSNIDTFNPIGPPEALLRLSVGETRFIGSHSITRLSQSPDVFIVKNFVSVADRETMMQQATLQGMEVAGTRKSDTNTIRRHSYITWIDPYSILGLDDAVTREAVRVAKEMVAQSASLFAHESLHGKLDVAEVDYIFAEDVQVAKYNYGGMFQCHHDGFSRYLTVLSYLNGVGGTYFPFALSDTQSTHEIDTANEEDAAEIAKRRIVGRDGVLIVGKEGPESYLAISKTATNSIVTIEAGDAVVFYNYKANGDRDWRSLHCSLTVQQEKWIATNWFRSEALTGPFSWLKKASLLEDMMKGGMH